jgi:hypothetical protein
LEDLSQTFARLAVINDLPEDLKQREFVVNCALDVRSASMAYLAINIKHDSTLGGTAGKFAVFFVLTLLGKIAKTFFLGDTKIVDAGQYLESCVTNYRRALLDVVGIPLIIETRELLKGSTL